MEDVSKHPRLTVRGNRYWFRAKIPADLQGHFKERERTFSLGTSDYREAVEKVRVESVKFDQEMLEARRKAAAEPVNTISDTEIQRLAAIYLSEVLEEDEEVRREGLDDRGYQKIGEALDLVDLGGRHALARGNGDHLAFEVDDLLERNGVKLDRDSEAYRKLTYAVSKASVRATEMMLKRHGGEVVDTPQLPPEPTAVPVGEQGESLKALIAAYLADPGRNRSQKAKDGYKVIFGLLEELIGGNRSVKTITRAECEQLREVLMRLPTNAKKVLPGLSLQEAATVAKERGLRLMTPGTVNSYLNNLSALFRWGVKTWRMDRNPAEGLQIVDNVKARDKKAPFTVDALKTIFSAPLYTGCVDDESGYGKRGPNHPRRGRFWVPLLSLWSGMRLNECCQLLTADVRQIDGVWCIIISEDQEEGGDEGDRKRVKTDAGERYVPVHPELERIGFLTYAEQKREEKVTKLFPELPRGANGYYSDPFSKWFSGTGRFLDKLGLKSKQTTFHSLRHTYRDAMREANFSRDVVLQLGGWAGGRTDDDYGKGLRASTLYREIEKVAYPGLDLSHLHQT